MDANEIAADGQKAAAWLKSHQLRLTYEGLGLVLFFVVVVVACLVGLWSDAMAARLHTIAGDIKDFLGLLWAAIVALLTRGGFDHGVNTFGDRK